MRWFLSTSVTVLLAVAAASAVTAVPIPPNVPVTGPLPGLQNEEQVWICPQDTSIVITNHRDFRLGYRQIGLGRSTDGGGSWVDSLISPDYQIFTHQSDPIMTVNSSGDIFISHLDYRGDIASYDSSYIALLVSEDCGATWEGPYTIEDTIGPYFEDKPFMTCDRTLGPYDGNLYVTWTRFDNPTRIMFARSTDNGASFEDTVVVGAPHYVSCFDYTFDAGQFSQPLVGKDGTVYVFWVGTAFDTLDGNCNATPAMCWNESLDGGVTFIGESVLFGVDGSKTIDGGVDVYNQPITAADLTDGPYAGSIYLQYRRNGKAPYDSDIYSIRSSDNGHHWFAADRVNDDPEGVDVDQFHNWLVCNDEGILVSVWYDQRTDPAHTSFDVFAAYSFDGGRTWTTNHRVSSVSIQPAFLSSAIAQSVPDDEPTPGTSLGIQSPQAGLIAEYIGVSCVDDKVVAVWTDTRDATGPGEQDVYSATWPLQVAVPRPVSPINGAYNNGPLYLWWSTSWKVPEDSYRVQMATDSEFNNVFLDEIVDTSVYATDDYPDQFGTLYWRVKAYGPNEFGDADSTEFCEPAYYDQGSECFCFYQSDFDEDGFLTPIDLAHMIDILFAGAEDVRDFICPFPRADFDADGFSTALDLAVMIDHLYAGGLGPCDPCAPDPRTQACAI